ncbi:MAG: FAD-binding oxidoreductase [Chloroflexota bacterium]|nr:FAD-binding oxidoreductase [Chloroflexota bacterium]
MVREAVLHSHLESILGSERVFPREEAASYAVDGIVPQAVALPATVEEVAEVMRLAQREGVAVIPWGGGSAMTLGNSPRRYHIALCLSRLNEVVEHEPADLTATVQAGMTLASFQRHLAASGQFLPLDPPSPQSATIGGILAANASGPSRHAYGTARDLALGMRLVMADGRIIKAGGRVVKNVAGYDMVRLLIGSLGTLGIIVEASLKLAPLPKAERTLAAVLPSAQSAFGGYRFAAQAAGLSLRAVELLNAPAAKQACLGRKSADLSAPDRQVAPLGEVPEYAFALVLAAAGEAAAVERSLNQMSELSRQASALSLTEVDASVQGQLWESIAGLALPSANETSLVCKAAALPSRVPALISGLQAAGQGLSLEPLIVSHLTAGIVYSIWPLRPDGTETALELVTALRQTARELGGSLVVEACPPALKERIDVWGEPGPDFPLMRRIKEQLDPQAILNPGRFLGKL